MRNDFTFFQLPAAPDFADRITDLSFDGKRFWYARRDRDVVGMLDPQRRRYQEFRLEISGGADLGLGRILTRRSLIDPRRIELIVAAEKASGLVFLVGGQRRGELVRYGPFENHQVELQPYAIGLDRNDTPWSSMWLKDANQPLSAGWELGFCRIEPGTAGGRIAPTWLLPPHANAIRSFWFDDRNRAWFAMGQGNALVGGGYSLGFADTALDEHVYWDVPVPGQRDHGDIAGIKGGDDLWLNWSAQDMLLKTHDIYMPYPGPGTPSRVDAFNGLGDLAGLATDRFGNLWGTVSSGLAGVTRTAAPDQVLTATAIDEGLQRFTGPTVAETVRVGRADAGEATATNTRIDGAWESTHRMHTWPLTGTATGAIPTDDGIWFVLSRDAQIGFMRT